jgi:hypothetical protein
MKSLVRRIAFAAFAVALGATVACNAVLGIEEAKLDPGEQTQALTCEYPQDDPNMECPIKGECESCLESEAPGATANCINAPAGGTPKSCRAALVEYRLCLGDNCSDENGNCAGCLSGDDYANQLGAAVRACPACRTSPIATMCESYCACMREKCAAPAMCEDTCGMLSPYEQYCRWQHCERAADSASFHCGHAIGMGGFCTDTEGPVTRCEKVWDGLGCDDPNECCNVCRDGVCAPN